MVEVVREVAGVHAGSLLRSGEEIRGAVGEFERTDGKIAMPAHDVERTGHADGRPPGENSEDVSRAAGPAYVHLLIEDRDDPGMLLLTKGDDRYATIPQVPVAPGEPLDSATLRYLHDTLGVEPELTRSHPPMVSQDRSAAVAWVSVPHPAVPDSVHPVWAPDDQVHTAFREAEGRADGLFAAAFRDREPVPETTAMTDWEQIGAARNATPGGVFRTPDGTVMYVKAADSEVHAKVEALANRLYRRAGVPVAENMVVVLDDRLGAGRLGIASTFVDGAQQLAAHLDDPRVITPLRADFAADAWLANWDVVGRSYGNVVLRADDGAPIRIDQGGALLFRGQGQVKGELFGARVDEIGSMRDTALNPQAAQVFAGCTDAEIRGSVQRIARITEPDIHAEVQAARLPPDISHQLEFALKQRRFDLLSRYPPQELRAPDPAATHLDHTAAETIWRDSRRAQLPETRRAVQYYNRSFGSGLVNGTLRGSESAEAAGAFQKAVTARKIRLLDAALAVDPVPVEVEVTRAVHEHIFTTPIEDLVGTPQVDHGFMSTTIGAEHPYFDGQAVLHLRVPAGTPALYFGGDVMYPHHQELLLGRGRIWMPERVERVPVEPAGTLDPDSVLHIYGRIMPEPAAAEPYDAG
ncbi:MAG: type effector HopAG1 [Glaciihabitans sp.]|nr:type effector HopAG1 [Glaciihabitans sp.]